MSDTTTKRRNPHPASGNLATAVVLMADRLGNTRLDMFHLDLDDEQWGKAYRASIRRRAALNRLVSALERRCQQRCCRR
jgi:hypothetical protein